MNISVNRLLDKIGAELSVAKGAESEAKIRERIQAIKAICEVILEESSQPAKPIAQTYQAPRSVPTPMPTKVDTLMGQPKRLDVDKEANGDSIFDF